MLSYPMGGILDGSDYVIFNHYEYKSNRQRREGANPPSAGMIRIYMPNSTPQITNSNAWGPVSIPGPIGAAVMGLAAAGGTALNSLVDADASELGSSIDQLKNTFSQAAKNGRGIAGQIGVNAIASATGLSAKQLTSLSMGKIFNPNTELTYDGPGLRNFNLQFNMIPKNGNEAQMINEIIMEFKKWAAPAESGQGMYELPHIWTVKYVSAGREDAMNRFKPCALANITVQANPTAPYHSTFTDGSPIETAISLDFKEVELITRDDHEQIGGQGY